MGKASVNIVKIRQVYNRHGNAYCAIGLPVSVMRHLGLQPGEYMAVFPTKDGAIKMVRQNAVMEVDPDYDPDSAPAAEQPLGPRKGSLAEREEDAEREIQKMIRKLSTKIPMRRDDDGDGDEDEDESEATEDLDLARDQAAEKAAIAAQQKKLKKLKQGLRKK